MENVITRSHISAAGNNVSYRPLKDLFAGERARFRNREPFVHACRGQMCFGQGDA